MATLVSKQGKYRNTQALSNVISDISRTRKNESIEKKNELISFGTIGVSSNPFDAKEQMLLTQHLYRINARKGRRCYHEILDLQPLSEELISVLTPDDLTTLARTCASHYYNQGFQCAYAVHNRTRDESKHIHFCISSVSYLDGHKFHSGIGDYKQRKALFDSNIKTILSPYIYSPITFNGGYNK